MNTKEMYTAAICRGDLKQCPTGSNNSNNNKSITPHELRKATFWWIQIYVLYVISCHSTFTLFNIRSPIFKKS